MAWHIVANLFQPTERTGMEEAYMSTLREALGLTNSKTPRPRHAGIPSRSTVEMPLGSQTPEESTYKWEANPTIPYEAPKKTEEADTKPEQKSTVTPETSIRSILDSGYLPATLGNVETIEEPEPNPALENSILASLVNTPQQTLPQTDQSTEQENPLAELNAQQAAELAELSKGPKTSGLETFLNYTDQPAEKGALLKLEGDVRSDGTQAVRDALLYPRADNIALGKGTTPTASESESYLSMLKKVASLNGIEVDEDALKNMDADDLAKMGLSPETNLSNLDTFNTEDLTSLAENESNPTIGQGLMAGGAGVLGLVNDAYNRFANSRSWNYDSPLVEDDLSTDENEGDTPAVEYVFKDGQVFQEDQRNWYYKVPHAGYVSDKDMSEVTYADPRVPQAGEEPDGTFEDGSPMIWGSVVFPDSTKISRSDYETGVNSLAYEAFTDGDQKIIVSYADGSKPENVPEYGTRQIDRGTLNWETVNPRQPWKDASGRSIFSSEIGDVDWGDILTDSEVLPWLWDMQAGSLPYMIPYPGNILVALSQMYPALKGVDNSTYMPAGTGLENFGEPGSWQETSMTKGQKVGQVLSPVIDQWMERLGGEAIGGLDLLGKTKLGKKILEHPVGAKLLNPFISEGAEELVVSPFEQLGNEGFRDFGKNSYYDYEKGDWVYEDTSVKDRLLNTGENALDSYLAGGILGTSASVTGSAMNAAKANASKQRAKINNKDIPDNAPSAMVEDERLDALEKTYRDRNK